MPRLTINVSEEMIKRLDQYADAMGTPRASLCTMLIGQGVMNYENANKIASDVLERYSSNLLKDPK